MRECQICNKIIWLWQKRLYGTILHNNVRLICWYYHDRCRHNKGIEEIT